MPHDQEEHTPAECRQDLAANEPGQRPSQRNAHDGERHRERPLPAWNVFGRQRGGIGHRSTKAEPREKPEDAKGPEAG